MPDATSWAQNDVGLGDPNVNVSVLDNDVAPAGFDYFSLRIVEEPRYGTATVNIPQGNPANAKIRYVAGVEFAGSDSLRYEICDLEGSCAVATLTITS